MKQRHRLRPLAAALLASLLLAMPASASWGYSEETSTQTGDYVNSDDAEAQRQLVHNVRLVDLVDKLASEIIRLPHQIPAGQEMRCVVEQNEDERRQHVAL